MSPTKDLQCKINSSYKSLSIIVSYLVIIVILKNQTIDINFYSLVYLGSQLVTFIILYDYLGNINQLIIGIINVYMKTYLCYTVFKCT